MVTAVVREQRRVALRRANEVYRQRAALKRELRAGRVSVADVLASPPEFLGSARVFDVLLWPVGRGSVGGYVRADVMAGRVLARADVGAFALVGELTERQRRVLGDQLRGGRA